MTVRASVFVAVKAEVVGDDTVRHDRNRNKRSEVQGLFFSVAERVRYLSAQGKGNYTVNMKFSQPITFYLT